MHGPAFSRTHRRTPDRSARAWALENWLTWHRPARGGPGRCAGSGRRLNRPGWRLVYRARPGLRNNHSGRWSCTVPRRLRGRRCRWRGRSTCHRSLGRLRTWGNHRRCNMRWRLRCRLRRSWARRRRGHRGWRRRYGCRMRRRGRCHNFRGRSRRRPRRYRSGGLCEGRSRRRLGLGRRWHGTRRCRRGSLLLAQEVENITRLGDMREVDLGLDLITFSAAGARRSPADLGFACLMKMSPHFVGFVVFERTGMGLFFRDTDFGKHIENRLAFDFQFSGQIVDSNLAHPPFRPPQLSRLSLHVNLTYAFALCAPPRRDAREVQNLLFLLGGSAHLLRLFRTRRTLFGWGWFGRLRGSLQGLRGHSFSRFRL
jgi:hypothetical protein